MPQVSNYIYKQIVNEDGTVTNELDRIEYVDMPDLDWQDKKVIRENQVLELSEYLMSKLTTQQYANIMGSIRTHISDWYLGVPRLLLWFVNGQDSNWNTNFTTNGFAQMNYYTVEIKNKAVDILKLL